MRINDRLERRHGRRYPIQLPLVHTPRALRAERGGIGWTRNLSEQGACVELAERLQSPMPFLLYVQTDRGVIDVEAAVAWWGQSPQSEGGILHGVTFTRFDPDQRRDLQGLFLSKGLMRPTKVRLPFEVTVTCRRTGRARLQLQGRTRDLSRGGLLLRLGQVVPSGTALELTLHTPPPGRSRWGQRSCGWLRRRRGRPVTRSATACGSPPSAGPPPWPWRASSWSGSRVLDSSIHSRGEDSARAGGERRSGQVR